MCIRDRSLSEGEVETFQALFSRPAAFDPYVQKVKFPRILGGNFKVWMSLNPKNIAKLPFFLMEISVGLFLDRMCFGYG